MESRRIFTTFLLHLHLLKLRVVIKRTAGLFCRQFVEDAVTAQSNEVVFIILDRERGNLRCGDDHSRLSTVLLNLGHCVPERSRDRESARQDTLGSNGTLARLCVPVYLAPVGDDTFMLGGMLWLVIRT